MTFTASLSTHGRTALLTLEGDLDASTAATFREEVSRAAEGDVDQLVLEMSKLNYLSSAGLRGLVFARQKLAENVRIVLVQANDSIAETIRLVGFDRSVVFSDHIPE
jgi:anti-anti-sigma factor